MMTDPYYKNRKRGGREQQYKTADSLLSKAFEYFAWCEDNPWTKKELMRSGDRKGEVVEVPISRPYTLAGMCVYCGISEATFDSYLKDPDMRQAAEHLQGIVRQNQMEGAIIGAYHSGFISQILASVKELSAETTFHPYVIEVTDEKAKKGLETMISNLRRG